MGGRTIALPFAVDFVSSFGPLRTGRSDPTTALAPDRFVRALRTPAGPATLAATHNVTHLEVQAWGPGADWALDAAPGLLGCLDDRHGFAPGHPVVARLHDAAPGLRLPRTGLVMDALIPAVLADGATPFEAERSYRLLVDAWGTEAPGPEGLRLPPAPEVIAERSFYELHVIGVEKARADTLHRVCAHAAGLTAASADPDLRGRLEATPGVTAWAAAETVRRVTGDPDVVSVGERTTTALVIAALDAAPAGETVDPTTDRMLELLEPFAPHRGRVCRLVVVAAAGLGPLSRP